MACGGLGDRLRDKVEADREQSLRAHYNIMTTGTPVLHSLR